MNIFKFFLMAVLMVSGASAYAMDPVKTKAEITKPVPSLFAHLFCCAARTSSERVEPLKEIPMQLINRTLIEAAMAGSTDAVQAALKKDAQVNAQDENGQTALHKAIIASYKGETPYIETFHERPKLVELLMQAGADCTIEDNRQVSPLKALRNYYGWALSIVPRIAPSMLRNIARCKRMTNDPQESLDNITYRAAYATLGDRDKKELQDQYYSLITDSLRAGSDTTNRVCITKGTIYVIACNFNDQRMKDLIATFQKEHGEQVMQAVRLSLPPALYPIIFECLYSRPQAGVMTGYCRDLLAIPLSTTQIRDDVFEKFKRFESVDGDVWHAKDNQGNTAIRLAVAQGNLSIVKQMNNKSSDNIELYLLARKHGHSEIVGHYLKRIYEDVQSAIRNSDATHLMKLIDLNDRSIVNNYMRLAIKLLGRAIDPIYNEQHLYDKRFEIVKILFAAGADINDASTGRTILGFSEMYELQDVIKLLLYLGADSNIADTRTKLTPWEQAESENIKELLRFPHAIEAHLTAAEIKEFADIKAEREKSLAKIKTQNSSVAVV